MLAKWISCLYWVKSYYRKTFFCKNDFFSIYALWMLNRWSSVTSEYTYVCENSVKELSNALLRGTIVLLVFELFVSLPKIVELGQIWPLVTWWPDLSLDLKHDWSIFVMLFNALSNAAYCVSLCGSGAELERCSSATPPARRIWRRTPTRRRLNTPWTIPTLVNARFLCLPL